MTKKIGFEEGIFEEYIEIVEGDPYVGPINIPLMASKGILSNMKKKIDSEQNLVESDFWELFFPPTLIQNWTVKTNKWFQEHEIKLTRG